MIKAENLTRHYGDLVAVDDVSFEIPRGQIVGLLGHNGAGKTTIMKMLTGYLEPTSGRAYVDDVDIDDDRLAVQRKIGYLPESCPLYPEMTVIDFLEYVADLRDIPADKRKDVIRAVVQKTELGAKVTEPIRTLSKGYKQRVGVAQAIIHGPEILIMDEPTSGLDPSQIQEIRGLVKELSENATIILSTHILQEVQAVCDRVIIISQGKIALDAELAALQHSNRLAVEVDGSPETLQKNLSKVSGLTAITEVAQHNGAHRYILDLSDEAERAAASADIAKAIVKGGMQLFSLHPERRDLETIFQEITSGKQEDEQA